MRRADAFSRFRLWNKQIKLVPVQEQTNKAGSGSGGSGVKLLTKDEALRIAANITKLPAREKAARLGYSTVK
jgi:hypothetical protein